VGGSDRTRRLVDGLGLFSLGLGTTQLVAPDAVNRLVGVEDGERSRAVQRWFGGAREVATGAGIESRRRPGLWLWTRVAGDVLDLSMLGGVVGGQARRPDARRRAAMAMATVAGVLVVDVVAALRLRRDKGARKAKVEEPTRGIQAKGTITINRPVGEVFAYWHDLENLPRFMAHLESVESLGGGRSRWRAAAPARAEVVWDAEISDERIDEFIAWRSVPDAKVTNWGEVEFRAAPGRRGTEVRVRLTYDPPAGKLGARVAKLFGEAPDQQIHDDLRRFKQVLETGQVVRSEGSPEGTKTLRQIAQRPAQPVPS
jgi:uncharacterized membrane protein